MFWVIAAGLLIAAALFVVVPFLRRVDGAGPAADPGGSDAVVRALYRDRVAELEAEAAAGRLDADVREQVLEELGASLLDDYREFEAAGVGRGRSSREGSARFGWALAIALPLVGFGVYWFVGEPTADSVAGASVVLRLDPEKDRAELDEWRARLERRVAREPDDAQSWYLLGSAALQIGEFAPASEAFARAAAITGPDPVVDVYWLQARYLAQGGQFDPRTREIAERILERNPSHPLVLELYAIDAYRGGEFRAAVGYLNRALNNDLGEQQVDMLLAGLDAARARMEPLLPSIEVAVSATDAAPRDAVLFVIARPPGGGMPYAVVRRPASRVPVTVQLDDTVSMNPELPLSRAPEFEVVVRLSRSGTPAPHPGDWEWRSRPFAAGDLTAPVALEAHLEAPVPAPPAESAAPGT
jgi:cytochrome c-type biogenesis protein CcmH